MPVALVLGCNGQDGTFLSRGLLRRGYRVIGVGKQPEPRFSYARQTFTYAPMDLALGSAELAQLLEAQRPDSVFHVAAVHASASAASYETRFQDMLAVNVGSLHAVLEYARLRNPQAGVLYASSAKVFGSPLPAFIDETTPRVSSCLYSITKNAAGDLLSYYREAHGCRASQLYLFNHESELRPASFFIPKLVRMLAAGAQGEATQERFATLDFCCDWGSAEEYMELAIDCLEHAPAQDFVLATGRCLSARDLVTGLAAKYGRDVSRLEAHSESTPRGQSFYRASTAKLRTELGRSPQQQIEQLVERLVEQLQARGK